MYTPSPNSLKKMSFKHLAESDEDLTGIMRAISVESNVDYIV